MPTALQYDEMAAQYGWATAVFKSNGELWKLFTSAVSNGWNDKQFVARLRNTTWFKKHSAATRQAAVLRGADPAEYKRVVTAKQAAIGDMAGSMGAAVNNATIQRIAFNTVNYGLTDAELRNSLSNFIVHQKGSAHFFGQAAADENQIREFARANGVNLSFGYLQNAIRGVARGDQTIDSIKQNLRGQAEKMFPAYSQDISSGVNVIDIAAPFIQTMGQILEVNPTTLDPLDPTIRKAMTRMGKDGKPSQTPVWQFENELRKDPRWLKTKNAQDSVMAAGHQVLADFGMAS